MPNYLMVLMAVSVGGMVVLQAGSNALLGRLLGHPLSASLTSLGVSLGAVCLSLGGAPWWSWLGGLFGAAYLTVAILVAPRLGAATFIACVVAGQMLVSALCDQFGWAGFPVRRLSWEGYLGLALVVAGVLLLQWRGRA